MLNEQDKKEAKVEEGGKKLIEVTVGGKYRFYENWKHLSLGYAPPEIHDWLDKFAKLDVDKFLVGSYILAHYIDRDPREVAKKVASWAIDLRAAWEELRAKKAGEGGDIR